MLHCMTTSIVLSLNMVKIYWNVSHMIRNRQNWILDVEQEF